MKRENIKYVVLGIGLGFLIAAGLFLRFGGREKEALSEREIIERAKDLGMVFLTEVPGAAKETVNKPNESSSAAADKENAKPENATSEKEEKIENQGKTEKTEKTESSETAKDAEPNKETDSNKAKEEREGKVEQPAPVVKPQEIAPPKQPAKPKTTPSKAASDVVTEVISGDDPAAKDLLPPPNSKRPKSTETLPTNHF